ncbi:unnamed protein product [Moneuplotes crassus]|uniref:Uncharacterized protein n=1 Tax=Euplotes crassus TaxID=5936 RepID=A0AAD1XPN3_EUPCR|nr:unnamed protein product [Moneuplotes crassus]
MGCSNARTVTIKANGTELFSQNQSEKEAKPGEKQCPTKIKRKIQADPGRENPFDKQPQLSRDLGSRRSKSSQYRANEDIQKSQFLERPDKKLICGPLRSTNELIRKNCNKNHRKVGNLRKGINQRNDLHNSKEQEGFPNVIEKSGDINALINDLATDQDNKLYQLRENGRYLKSSVTVSRLEGNLDGSELILFDQEASSNFDKSADMRLVSKEESINYIKFTEKGIESYVGSKSFYPKNARNVSPALSSFEFKSKHRDTQQDSCRNYDQELDRLLS